MNKDWISVKDRLPDTERVLVKTTVIGIVVAGRCGELRSDRTWGEWYWGVINSINLECEDVTHWMPLPKQPKESK